LATGLCSVHDLKNFTASHEYDNSPPATLMKCMLPSSMSLCERKLNRKNHRDQLIRGSWFPFSMFVVFPASLQMHSGTCSCCQNLLFMLLHTLLGRMALLQGDLRNLRDEITSGQDLRSLRDDLLHCNIISCTEKSPQIISPHFILPSSSASRMNSRTG
jgi:hypothetical protein